MKDMEKLKKEALDDFRDLLIEYTEAYEKHQRNQLSEYRKLTVKVKFDLVVGKYEFLYDELIRGYDMALKKGW